MKPYKTFTPPEFLLSQIGVEYAGTYTIHVLNAKEYLQAAEELTQQKRFDAQKEGKQAEPFTEAEFKVAILYKSVTKDGELLPQELPSKLYEILSSVAIPLNTYSQEEGRQLFECFRGPEKN
jgi:hypothetical protein